MFEKKSIPVSIDQLLQTRNPYQVSQINTPIRLNFRPAELIYNLGIVETKRKKPTFFNRFWEFMYLNDYLQRGTDVKIDTNYIRQRLGFHRLGKISDQYGEAFALLSFNKLLDTKLRDIQRINLASRQSGPDYRGISAHGDTINLEAKGSTDHAGLNSLMNKGIRQKNSAHYPSTFGVVSGILLNQNTPSELHLIDPPGKKVKINELERQISRCQYYRQAFSLLGLPELSRYFTLMEKRLILRPKNEWHTEKMEILSLLKYEYSPLTFNNDQYLGTFVQTSSLNLGKIVFCGIKKDNLLVSSLLSSDDNAIRSKSKLIEQDQNDTFYFPEEGVIVAELNPDSHYLNVRQRIFNPTEEITLDDFHYSNIISATNALRMLFEHDDRLLPIDDEKCDMIIEFKNKYFRFHFLRFYTSNPKEINKITQRAISQSTAKKNTVDVIVTPNKLPSNSIDHGRSKIVLDRTALLELIRRKISMADLNL